MHAICWLLILAVTPPANTATPYPDSTTLYACDFEPTCDADFDLWPDEWTRLRGPGWPAYLHMGLTDGSAVQGQQCLTIELDGGQAGAVTAPMPITVDRSQVALVQVRTQGLKHDVASAVLTYLDAARHPLVEHQSLRITETAGWTQLQLGPFDPPGPAAKYVSLTLQVKPEGERADLNGTVSFDQVWLGELPRYTLSANAHEPLVPVTAELEFTATTRGTAPPKEVNFEVRDALGNQQLHETVAAEGDGSAILWRPKITQPGFYRVSAEWPATPSQAHRRELVLAIVAPAKSNVGPEFGWSCSRADPNIDLTQLPAWLQLAGVGALRWPVWFAETDTARASALMALSKDFTQRSIRLVGILDRPPTTGGALPARDATALDYFSLPPEKRNPLLEPVFSRLALDVRWWQLGASSDCSIASQTSGGDTAQAIRALIDATGQDSHLAWMAAPKSVPASPSCPLHVEIKSATQPAAEKLAAGAPQPEKPVAKADSQLVSTWLDINAPAPGAVAQRAGALARQMLEAKERGARAVFFVEPFDAERGLLSPDGNPTELLLPWRSMALALSGTKMRGTLTLASGAENRLLTRGEDATLILWSDSPVKEESWWGAGAQCYDLFGRSLWDKATSESPNAQAIELGPMPVIISGLHTDRMLFRSGVEFRPRRIPNVLGVPHEAQLILRNPMSTPLAVEVRAKPPAGMRVTPERFSVEIAPGLQHVEPLSLVLPPDAQSGRPLLRFDVTLTAGGIEKFSVFQPLEVGIGDFELSATTHLNADGDLEVYQQLVNHTSAAIRLRCQLFAPDRRRQRLPPILVTPGMTEHTYKVHEGAKLIGRDLLLRADEVGGDRVLNFRCTVKP